MTPPQNGGGTVWVVFHPGWEDAVAVFSTLEKAKAAYPGCEYVQFMVDPARIFDLSER